MMTSAATTSTTKTDNVAGISTGISDSSSSEKKKENEHIAASTDTDTATAVVYQSPLGSVVSRLRALSLLTAVAGVVGVPAMMAIKGAVPEVGMLATALSFVGATTASTAAVHFVFRPYIYQIQAIPVRQCSYPKKTESDPQQSDGVTMTETDSSNSTPQPVEKEDDDKCRPQKKRKEAYLLKAMTRTLFLRQADVVFDPETDVEPYKGLRPLSNFQVKGVPLYVHTGKYTHAHRQANCGEKC